MASKTTKEGIHFIKAALDEVTSTGREGKQIVLRGVLDQKCLEQLKVDEYQREPLPLSALSKLWQALQQGESLPDIELGMRGLDFEASRENDEFWLKGDVYIIDGQQRRNAAVHILSIMPDLDVRLGAMVHFGTTRQWERERFKILNLDRSRVSANVLLRNMRHQSAAVLTLYGLCHSDASFALFERVCWKQSQSTNELTTARTLATIAATIHSHCFAASRSSLGEMIPALDRQAAFVKLDRWRKNIIYFFDFVDEAWGLRNVTYRDLSLQTRLGFLVQVAMVLSDHCNFWRDPHETELYIEAEWRKRFASFPLHDPTVVSLVAGGGGSRTGGNTNLLYSLLRDHLNKGRSTNRLRNREDEYEANRPRQLSSMAPSDIRDDEDEMEYPGRES